MNDLVLTLLATLVTGSGAGGLVGWVMSRNKIGAETNQLEAQAAEIIERTAGASVERLSKENTTLQAKVLDLERKVERLERRELVQRDLMQVHAGWDFRALELLRRNLTPEQLEAEQLHPAPPLFPPA